MPDAVQRVTTGWLAYRDRQAAAQKIDWSAVVLTEPGPRRRGLVFRKAPKQITGHQLRVAPVRMREALAQSLVALGRLEKTRAWTEGWLGELDLRGARWELAQRVLTGVELNAAINAIEKAGDPNLGLDEARTLLESCVVQVERDADSFVATTDRAVELSRQLAEPGRRAALDRGRAIADQKLLRRQARLDAAMLASRHTPSADVTALSDAVNARIDAYDDLP